MSEALFKFLDSCPEITSKERDDLDVFLRRHLGQDGVLTKPIVCLTSGGTTVPLERRCVRYIDNFTTGTRGALSAEEFLSQGYLVVFLTRDSAFQPFTLDLGTQNPAEALWKFTELKHGEVKMCKEQETKLKKLLGLLEHVYNEGLLFTVNFISIFDYMRKLEWIGKELGKFGNQSLFYLAAAVSDFYLPWDEMLEHKIQSAEGKLELALHGVPKALGTLRHNWAPKSYIMSFKLETQEEILISKAKGAIENYGVHGVIANLLHTRKDRVLVLKSLPEKGKGECEISTIDRKPQEPYIEKPLIQMVIQLHREFIENQNEI